MTSTSSASPLPVVLYAENDENDALLMQVCWRRAGLAATLRVVEDGHEAMAYLSGEGGYADRAANPFPALVLLDLSMPGCSGLEVLSWVRAQPRFADLPVMILSLSNQEKDRSQALALGASDYVVKPTGLAGFVETLRGWPGRWLPAQEG
jgi:CheY-like chemotaxis protein